MITTMITLKTLYIYVYGLESYFKFVILLILFTSKSLCLFFNNSQFIFIKIIYIIFKFHRISVISNAIYSKFLLIY